MRICETTAWLPTSDCLNVKELHMDGFRHRDHDQPLRVSYPCGCAAVKAERNIPLYRVLWVFLIMLAPWAHPRFWKPRTVHHRNPLEA